MTADPRVLTVYAMALETCAPAPTRRSRPRVATLALLLVLTVAVGAFAMVRTHGTGAAPQQRIEEDSPQWNCHTMGNRVCGKDKS